MQTTITAGRSMPDRAAYLLVIDDAGSRRIPLPPAGELVAGRADDADIPVRDASASRRHVKIATAGGTVHVTDLNSHNGTRVNGKPIAGAFQVVTGDVIEIGKATLIPNLATMRWSAHDHGDRDAILRTLRTEVSRARKHERTVGIVLAHSDAPLANGLAAAKETLSAGETAGTLEETTLLFVLPETRGKGLQGRAKQLRSVLATAAPDVRVAVAGCPADGTDAGSLLGVARSRLDGTAERLTIADREVIMADRATARTYELLRRLARSDLAVLIAGETGVGKEMAAFSLHHWSPRSTGPFVPINCAALPANLVESELFGHEKGAFSGADAAKAGIVEKAAGGTLFLDEVGEMPAAAQAKLLRVLQDKKVMRVGGTKERPVDFRLVAATNRDVLAEVQAGRFREDLYYRVAAAVVELPPLRDRPRDVAVLAQDALARACQSLDRPVMTISDAAMRILCSYRFPGNVRELINAMEFAAATALDETVDPSHLPATMNRTTAAVSDTADGPGGFRPLADEVAELEARRIREALEATGGNQKAAAELIGMPRRTFVAKLGKYKLR